MKKYMHGLRALAVFFALILAAFTASATDYYLLASDDYNISSMNATGSAPGWGTSSTGSKATSSCTAGNNYYVTDGRMLRTPYSGNDYTFAGASLVFADGSLQHKLPTGKVLTIGNLIVAENGYCKYMLGTAANATHILAGALTIRAGGRFYVPTGFATAEASDSRPFYIRSNISGAGTLLLAHPSSLGVYDAIHYLSGDNSGFTGQLIVSNRVQGITLQNGAALPGDMAAPAADGLKLFGSLVTLEGSGTIGPNRGVTLVGDVVSTLAVKSGETLTISSPLTGAAGTMLNLGDATHAGSVRLSSASPDFAGTIYVNYGTLYLSGGAASLASKCVKGANGTIVVDTPAPGHEVTVVSAVGEISVIVAVGVVAEATPVYLAWDASDKGATLASWAHQIELGTITDAGGTIVTNDEALGIAPQSKLKAFVGSYASEVANYTSVLTLDFTSTPKPLRRALWANGAGGYLMGNDSKYYTDLKALNFSAARTHNWAAINVGERMCDLRFMFPLINLDTSARENYFFGPTDEILEMTIEDLDEDVMFRMGTSTEEMGGRNNHPIRAVKHFNTVEPTNWVNFADAHAEIIRHYTAGKWNGFSWGSRMKYWELWDEPDNAKEGGWVCANGSTDPVACRTSFCTFYTRVLSRLRATFPKADYPNLKFGGPALKSANTEYLSALLDACTAAGYAPDFISWHDYGDEPADMLKQPATIRALLDAKGFTDTELVIDAWHWYSSAWGDSPTRAQLADSTTGLSTLDSAIYALQVFMGVQETVLDQCYYYGIAARTGNLWGYRNYDESLNKSFYALKLFGQVVTNCDTFVSLGLDQVTMTNQPVRAFGAFSRAGDKAYLLVTSYRGDSATISVRAPGLGGYTVSAVTGTDLNRNAAALPTSFVTRAGNTFTFTKPTATSAAAYLVELTAGGVQ